MVTHLGGCEGAKRPLGVTLLGGMRSLDALETPPERDGNTTRVTSPEVDTQREGNIFRG